MRPQILRFCAAALLASAAVFAASHRNGPMLLEDQTANLNDFYIFRSYEDGRSDRVVMSMSAQGFQNPDNGPSYYKFSDSVLYRNGPMLLEDQTANLNDFYIFRSYE